MRYKDPKKIEKELRKRIRGEVSGDEVHRALYSTAACIYRLKPLAVAYPRDIEDLVQVVNFASQEGIPLTARGAGTGLAGQSLGAGLILDFSRHMKQILEIDPGSSQVRVQPGLVLGDLNRMLNLQGRFFPPDPSSGGYCTLGGMIANNSSGAHSVKYGATKDYILSLELVLANGKVVRTGPIGHSPNRTYLEYLRRRVGLIVSENRSLIEEKTSKVTKNSSGYNLQETLRGEEINLNALVAGSEGTLALVTEAVLRTVSLPRFRSTILLFFTDLERAAESIPEICRLGPSVLELMDRTFIDLVRGGRQALNQELPGRTKTLFLVEFEGNSSSEVQEKVYLLRKRIIEELRLAFASRWAFELKEQAQLWSIRKAASPLLDRLKGPGRPTRFIEDVAVEPAQLPKYIRGLQQILDRHGAPGVIFGHAGDGNVHVNPLLDLQTGEDIRRMEEIAVETYGLVKDLGGTLSGEHGDGRLRTSFLPWMYGELYEIFRQVKEVFDPHYLLNPDVIVSLHGEERITHHLHIGQDRKVNEGGVFFDHQELKMEIERCNRCGLCKTCCPAFQGTAYEGASPRAKIALLREVVTNPVDHSSAFVSREIKQVLELCLHCKRCVQECPLEVDIPRLTLAAKGFYQKPVGKLSPEQWLKYPLWLAKVRLWLGPLAERLAGSQPGRRFLEVSLGIHRDRLLPPTTYGTGRQEFFRNGKPETWSETDCAPRLVLPNKRAKVAYFEGCFARYYDKEVSLALVELLEKSGCQVVFPSQKCCGLPKLSYGDFNSARRDAQDNLESLIAAIDQGYQIVTACPSCGLALKKDYSQWWDTSQARRVAQNTFDAQEYLLILHREGILKGTWREKSAVVVYHDPCHLRAQGLQGAGMELVSLIPGVAVKALGDQCCGMAGTFGLRRRTFRLSLEIGAPLFQEILELEPTQVATSCGACRWQIQQGTSIQGVHPLVLLRQVYE